MKHKTFTCKHYILCWWSCVLNTGIACYWCWVIYQVDMIHHISNMIYIWGKVVRSPKKFPIKWSFGKYQPAKVVTYIILRLGGIQTSPLQGKGCLSSPPHWPLSLNTPSIYKRRTEVRRNEIFSYQTSHLCLWTVLSLYPAAATTWVINPSLRWFQRPDARCPCF